MKSKLIKANSLHMHDLPALPTRERVDMVRYEDSLGDSSRQLGTMPVNHRASSPTGTSIV
jgi:hypothetical protein